MLTQRLAVALALPLLGVTACSDEEPEAPTDVGSRSAAAIDYPGEGVDLVDRPTLKGVYQQALQTYVDFERGRRLVARQGTVGRLLAFHATARVVDPYREALASYSGAPYDGDVAIEFLDVQTRDSVVRIDICVDATALEVPDDGPTLLGEATRAPQRIEVANFVGPWRVTEVEPVDGSC